MAEMSIVEQEEFTALMSRAELMGMNVSPRIGLKTLRDKVNQAASVGNPEIDSTVEGEPSLTDFDTKTTKGPGIDKVTMTVKPKSRAQLINEARKEANRQVRVRVTCMDPNKKDWAGEVFSAGNPLLGSFKKYVPFNNDEGWHIPMAIYHMIKDKKVQTFVNTKDDRGNTIRKGRMVNAFSVEIMTPLTQAQLNKLAQDQRATDNN